MNRAAPHCHVRQMWAALLCCLLIFPPDASAAPRQAEASELRIEVQEGNGAINNIATRRARDVVVRVLGPGDQPVAGAVVTFVLPTSGPGAVFPDGSRTMSVSTGEDGTATTRALRVNDTEGQFEIRVNAVFEGKTARAALVQTNVRPAGGGGSNATKALLIVGLIAGAAAGAAVALGGGGGGSPSPSPGPSPTPGTTVSAGAPTFGPP